MPRCSTLSTPLINSLLCLLLCILLHCSPSDLMKSQWEVEGDIIDTHPTQLNPTQLQWEPTTLLQGFETKQLTQKITLVHCSEVICIAQS